MDISFSKGITILILFISLLTSTHLLHAQEVRTSKILNYSIAQKAQRLLQTSLPQQQIKSSAETVSSLVELDKFLSTQLFQTELIKDNWYASKIGQLKKRTGLNLSANYQHNEYNAFYENFENDARLRVGLDFDFLENGLVERRNEIKRLEKDQEIHRMESKMISRERDYAFLYNCLIYRFNIEKIDLLQKRIPFLEEYIRILYELYFAHELSYDQIIDQKSRLKEAEIMLAAAYEFNDALEEEIGKENIARLSTQQLPIVQIDIEQLLDPSEMDAYQGKIQQLKEDRIDLSYRKRIDSRFRVYTRYNYGSYQTETNDRSFTSFGVSLQMPIQFNRRAVDELTTFEKAMVEQEVSEVWYNRVKEIMILYEEYQYKIKQYSNFLHKTFHLEEKLRVERVLLDSPKDIHSPLRAIKHIDNNRAVEYELLHLKQQLYLLILKIQLRSFQKDFIDCLEPLDFSKEKKKLIGRRFAIIQAGRDDQLDPIYLIKYLQKNEITNIVLEGRGKQLKKWADLLYAEGFNLYGAEPHQYASTAALSSNLSGHFRKLEYSGQLMISSYKKTEEIPALQIQLTTVPDDIFKNRNELERWIQLENKTSGIQFFLFENISRIMELDKKNLGVE